MAGGGAIRAAPAIRSLAERLGAPVLMTVNARGVIPGNHPLAVPLTGDAAVVTELLKNSDATLALGTEFGPTDFADRLPATGRLPGWLARADLDAEQLMRGVQADPATPRRCQADGRSGARGAARGGTRQRRRQNCVRRPEGSRSGYEPGVVRQGCGCSTRWRKPFPMPSLSAIQLSRFMPAAPLSERCVQRVSSAPPPVSGHWATRFRQPSAPLWARR